MYRLKKKTQKVYFLHSLPEDGPYRYGPSKSGNMSRKERKDMRFRKQSNLRKQYWEFVG